MRPTGPRPSVVGPDEGPSDPFPIKLAGPIVKGFGRGSKELGIPTANIPIQGLSVGGHQNVESGVYYGWAGVNVDCQGMPQATGTTWPMVMSIGWNPYYKNSVRSVEVHIMHSFPTDFYGAWLNLVILGFIRPEYDYVSKESLIEDINTDIDVARQSLGRATYTKYKEEPSLSSYPANGPAKKL